jgi:uncharacterized protein
MRRKEKEITDPAEIESIVCEAPVCRIGLCDRDQPYVVPVCFGYREGCLFFHSAHEGRKIDMLRKNPLVCFEVDVPGGLTGTGPLCDRGIQYRSVIGFGVAEFLVDPEEKRAGLTCIVAHYMDEPAIFPENAVNSVTVIRVKITSMTGKQSS